MIKIFIFQVLTVLSSATLCHHLLFPCATRNTFRYLAGTTRDVFHTIVPMAYRAVFLYPANQKHSYPMLKGQKSVISNIVSINETREQFMSDKSNVSNDIHSNFNKSIDMIGNKFYLETFKYLTASNSIDKKENSISFVQSWLFVYLSLLTLSTVVDNAKENEIDSYTFTTSSKQMDFIKKTVKNLPKSNNGFKLHWSYRLVLAHHIDLQDKIFLTAAKTLRMRIDHLNNTNNLVEQLNLMVEEDSEGAMRNTFDEEDFSEDIHAVLLSTIYFRSKWRVAPVVLNGTIPFYNAVPLKSTEYQTTRAMKINDIVGYTDLDEWDAEAIEIQYSTKGLSLIAIIPKSTYLGNLTEHVAALGVGFVTQRMKRRRIAVIMPIYTLRMTLLLPNKLKILGYSRYFTENKEDDSTSKARSSDDNLKLSHAIQRIMFWAEAGRHAYKDDGLEWDGIPELELTINRPYIFFVRWKGITLLNGNFVL